MVKSKVGLHIRLLADQVLMSGWETVPEVHGLLLQHLVVVLSGHKTLSFMCLVLAYRSEPTVAKSYTVLQVLGVSIGPALPVRVVTSCRVHSCCFQPSVDDLCMSCDVPDETVKALVGCLVIAIFKCWCHAGPLLKVGTVDWSRSLLLCRLRRSFHVVWGSASNC